MIVVRFKAACAPGRAEELAAAMTDVVKQSRLLEGVMYFDVGRDITDSNAFIATEVFLDRPAMQHQEMLPAVKRVLELINGGALAKTPEWTVYDVASVESPALT
jgi:quinol monooxygenase YgiN